MFSVSHEHRLITRSFEDHEATKEELRGVRQVVGRHYLMTAYINGGPVKADRVVQFEDKEVQVRMFVRDALARHVFPDKADREQALHGERALRRGEIEQLALFVRISNELNHQQLPPSTRTSVFADAVHDLVQQLATARTAETNEQPIDQAIDKLYTVLAVQHPTTPKILEKWNDIVTAARDPIRLEALFKALSRGQTVSQQRTTPQVTVVANVEKMPTPAEAFQRDAKAELERRIPKAGEMAHSPIFLKSVLSDLRKKYPEIPEKEAMRLFARICQAKGIGPQTKAMQPPIRRRIA